MISRDLNTMNKPVKRYDSVGLYYLIIILLRLSFHFALLCEIFIFILCEKQRANGLPKKPFLE